jgi:hypothetical protein
MRLLDLRGYDVGVSPNLPDLPGLNPLWFTCRRTMVASTSGVLQLRYMALPLSLISTSISFNKVQRHLYPHLISSHFFYGSSRGGRLTVWNRGDIAPAQHTGG